MHEHKIYIYIIDKNYIPMQKQKDKALLFFEIIVAKAEHQPWGWSNAEISLDDGLVIESPFALTASFVFGSNKYWLINDRESAEEANEEDYDELPLGTELRPEIMHELEQILGTRLALVWEFND